MVTTSSTQNRFSWMVGLAVGLILATSLIHLFVQAPQDLRMHTARGLLLFVIGVLGLIATIGVYRDEKIWGWGLGLIVMGSGLVFFVVSRLTGFPWNHPLSSWTGPIELVCLVAEVGFVALTLRAFQPSEITE